jgi:hypothetical protein
MIDLSQTYQQSGDTDSAQTSLQMAIALGQRYATAAPGESEISQLVGIAVQKLALAAMDPNSLYGDDGQTVQDQLNQLTQQRQMYRDLNAQADPLMDNMSDQDYVTYKDRWMAFGEENALRWVIGKYGQP